MEIDTYPFNLEQRTKIFNGCIDLDRIDKIQWLFPHLTAFALRQLNQVPVHPSVKQTSIPHILIYGEAPGELEDATGKPFWGPAGNIFDNVIHQTTTTFFFTMTNTVCCRPTRFETRNERTFTVNRQPTPEEQEACLPHVKELLSSYEFTGILALGEIADKSRSNNFYDLPGLRLRHPSWILRQNYRHRYCVEQGMEIDEWVAKISNQ